MSEDDDAAEVVVPFKRAVASAKGTIPAQGTPSFNDLLITVEMMNQQIFILQQVITTLLAFSTERAREVGLEVIAGSELSYESAFDFWPTDVARPPVSEMIRIYKRLFNVRA